MPIGGMGSEEKWRLGDRLHREPRGRYGTWNLGHLVLGTTNAGQLVRRPTRTPTNSYADHLGRFTEHFVGISLKIGV